MKNLLIILSVPLLLFCTSARAQIENVIVETYYISDSMDATDTTEGRSLEIGSKTYRVYIDLAPGCKIKKIYGDTNHLLKISSTADFYNNIDRPTSNFGYLINKSWFTGNPTIALDSWLTLGLATKTHNGIIKSEDTDGSIIGGTNNNGGTAGIPGGLLVNNNPSTGNPLTTHDGLVPNDSVLSQWVDDGFRNTSGDDTTIFGALTSGSQFITRNAYLQQNSGLSGATEENKVLVAQLTTTGEISFELNVEILDSNGNSISYVANDSILIQGEELNRFLKYPFEEICGCPDPKYLEYIADRDCDKQDSCKTLIVFGCTDPLACNYNLDANFNLEDLCCYPGHCNDRDISVVCPSLANGEREFNLYPNPAQNLITLKVSVDDDAETKYVIYNAFGRAVLEKNIGLVSGMVNQQVDVSNLDTGLYLFRLFTGDDSDSKMFMKN